MTIPNIDFAELIQKTAPYSVKGLIAIAIFAAGYLFAKLMKSLVKKAVKLGKTEPTVGLFVANLVYAVILAVVIAAALGEVGVQTASIVAVIGAAGLAIGLALQGSLSNLASGLLIVMQRLFLVGDYIEGGGVGGTVQEIRLFTTLLKTFDGRRVIVPNARLMNDNIVNYSVYPTRRVEVVVSVDYSSDLTLVRKTALSILDGDERILPDPAPAVVVKNLGESGIDIAIRAWVNRENYWNVFFELQEKVKNSFDAAGITIPFPQRVVHLRRDER